MSKVKYCLFWVLMAMQSCLVAGMQPSEGQPLTFIAYKKKSDYSFTIECVQGYHSAVQKTVKKIADENPSYCNYCILSKGNWVDIQPHSFQIDDIDFYAIYKLENAFKKGDDNINLTNINGYESGMQDAFDEYKKNFYTQDELEERFNKWLEEENQYNNDSNANDYTVMKKAIEAHIKSTDDEKPSFFTVQNSFFLVILVTLGVAAFFLWLNDKKAPSEDETPKAKKLKTELRPKSEEVDDRQMKIQSSAKNDNPRSDTIATDD